MGVFELLDEHYNMQQGGTWEKQQARVKAEKDAKLKLLLQDKDFLNNLKEQSKNKEVNLKASDATKVVTKNRPELTSKIARNKTDKEIAQEREAKIQDSMRYQNIPFTKDNWREVLAGETKAIGDKLRVSNEPNFFDDYVNPAVMIGDMASNLGQAPLRAQQEDSYMPYVTAVGAPLTVGAVAGIGTQSTGQFVNNLANPLAGTGDLVNNAYSKGINYLENKGIRLSAPEEVRQGLRTNGIRFEPNFKSEINWSKWNKEIPDNPQLMQEYNAIEQTSKANGSWMKNPDGSAFQGTPEQFVQQNSENFKKAFGKSKIKDETGAPIKMYHSSPKNNISEFSTPKRLENFENRTASTKDTDYTFFTPNKEKSKIYGDNTYEVYISSQNPNNVSGIRGESGLPIMWNPEQIKNKELYDSITTLDFNNIKNEIEIGNKKGYFKEIAVPHGNYVKSTIGNNGMFDMTNPNIYKAVAPISLGAAYLGTQEQEEPKKFQQGGKFTENENKFLEELAQLKLI